MGAAWAKRLTMVVLLCGLGGWARAAEPASIGKLLWSQTVEGAPPLEGVAYDARGKRYFVSLIGGRTILVGSAGAGFRPLLRAGETMQGVFGLAFDPKRKAIWAAETSGPRVPGSRGPRRTGLARIDVATGKVTARVFAPADGREHWIGDVAVAPDGGAYASDSLGGAIYRLRPGGSALEALATSAAIRSPQGLVVLPDRRGIIFANYPTGLHRLDLASGAVEALAAPVGLNLRGVDGLVLHQGALYATQNGGAPQRVLRIRISADGRRVLGVDVLAENLAPADDLALLTVADGQLVFVARSGWAGFDVDGKPIAGAQAKPLLAALPLD